MNDEDNGRVLLRPLDTENGGGPSRVDVGRAMRDGLRARRVRTWSTGAAVTAGVAVIVTGGVLVLQPPAGKLPAVADLPADPGLPAACEASALPMGTAGSAGVNAGDPSGTYLVGSSEPVEGGDHDVLVWKNGKLVATAEQRSPKVAMHDINSSGVAVGATVAGNTDPYAYHDGKVTLMKGEGNAVAINDAGVVAGDTEGSRKPVPQRWPSWDAEPEMMPLPAGMAGGQAYDITEDGTILTALWGAATGGVYLWHADGSIEKIEPPVTADSGVGPIAFHFGWVYAELNTRIKSSSGMPGGTSSALYRYEPRSRTWEKLDDNRFEVQVPAVQRRGGGFIQDEPAVYAGREVLELPPLKRYDDDAFGVAFISEDARIVAGSNLSGNAAERPVHPVIWRCR